MTNAAIATTTNGTIPPTRRDERETANGKPPSASADLPRRSTDASTNAKAPPPALPLDLTVHSDELLWLIIAAAQSELQERKDKREADFIEQVREGARQLSMPYERLAARLGVKSARPTALRPPSGTPDATGDDDGRRYVKPKYRNPDNPAQVWTGRGKPPPWIQLGDERSERGTPLPLAKFRIPEGAP